MFIRTEVFTLSLAKTMSDRWAHVIGCPADMIALDEAGIRNALLSAPASIRFDALRTFLVGWTTGARLHLDGKELNGCFLGCPGCSDGLPHYVACLPLAEVCDVLMPMRHVGPLSCLVRFGILPVDCRRAATLATVYWVCAHRPSHVTTDELRDIMLAALAARGVQFP